MRLFVFNCLLLASVAVASPDGRHKRDLAYLKNLITSAIFGGSRINIEPAPVLQEENAYKLFQLPGYDDVIYNVAPKKPVVEEFVYPPAVEKVNLNAFGTVVGTKSKEDTLLAVKEVNNLLSTGILYGGQNNVMKETVDPMFPSLNTPYYFVEEKIRTVPVIKTRPVLTEEIETRPVLTEVDETRPAFTEVIRPVEEKVGPIVPFKPTYYFKQIRNNEPVMMYTGHNNPGVELEETIKMKNERPTCIKKRVDEAIVLGADPNRFAPVQEQHVLQYQSPPVVDFSYPLVQKLYQYQSPSFLDFSYPIVGANSYVQNSVREELTKEYDVTNGFGVTSQRSLKDIPVRYNLRPTNTKAINTGPNPLHSHKSLHSEAVITASKDTVNPPTTNVEALNNLGEKDDFPHTLGEYIARVNKGRNSIMSNRNMKQIKAVPIVGSNNNVSNANIPSKLQSNPNTGKVEKESDALRTNEKTNPNQYDIRTVVNSGTAKEDTAQEQNVVYSNKVTAKPQSVTSPVAVANTNAPKQPLRENIQTSIKQEPTDVENNENYSYLPETDDEGGSSVNVNGNKHGDAVSVEENNNRGRGDIPDSRE